MIKKFGKVYKILSKKGKNLGTASSKKDAQKRLQQIEYFKHKGKK